MVLTAVLIATAGGALAGAPGSGQTPVVYTTVTVDAGESLWEVARSVAPDRDPRSTVASIVELNQLSSPTDVRAGQLITVPASPHG